MSVSMGFDIHINESENILDKIEKTLEELNMEGYGLVSKYKKSMDYVTGMLTFTAYMADEEDKYLVQDIYNLMDITICCSMYLYSSIEASSPYIDTCKIVAELMKRFPGDCAFTDLSEYTVLIRFSGDVIVSEKYSEVNPNISLLNELENIPSTSILTNKKKGTLEGPFTLQSTQQIFLNFCNTN